MLPSLSPFDRLAGPVAVPPPPYFRPVSGVVLEAWRAPAPNFASGKRCGNSAGRKAGIRYEAKVQTFLRERFGGQYVESPWVGFVDNSGHRLCQFDGVLLLDVPCVVEVKVRHTSDSYFQLEKLYGPVAARLYNCPRVNKLTIVGSYDPATPYPVEVALLDKLSSAVPEDRIGVYQWTP